MARRASTRSSSPPARGSLRQLTATGDPLSSLTWSDHDRAIVFASDRIGTTSLWRLDVDDGALQPLRTVGMNASSPAANEGVLLYEEWKSEINVWKLDIASGGATPVAVSTRWDWRAQPSPDGTRLAFVSNRRGAQGVWLAGGDGSHPHEVVTHGCRHRQLAGVVARRLPHRWRPRTAAEAAELVDADFRPAASTDWVVLRGGIYYLRLDAAFAGFLTRFDPATGRHEDLVMSEGEGGIKELYGGAGLWVSADGATTLVSSIDVSHSDLWMRR